MKEIPQLLNPASGWLLQHQQLAVVGGGAEQSRRRKTIPAYVEMRRESRRGGLHAIRVLQNRRDFTLDSLIGAAYDSYLPWFEKPLPALIRAWDGLADSHPLKGEVAGAGGGAAGLGTGGGRRVRWLRRWLFIGGMRRGGRWGRWVGRGTGVEEAISRLSGEALVEALDEASRKIAVRVFGKWQTAWGEINRFQRGDGRHLCSRFSDAAPSIPVGFTSGTWGIAGQLWRAAYPETKKWYGTSGNSFVAVVEFGTRVKAKAVSAGGGEWSGRVEAF